MKKIKDNDISSLKDKECYIFFYFTASWCGPCQKVYPDLLELIKTLDSSKVMIYKIDIDKEENNEICEKCQIKYQYKALWYHLNIDI